MELLDAIFQRRTIKDFKPEVVPIERIERALSAGIWAQNHKLTEPWRFTVLGSEAQRRLAEGFADSQLATLNRQLETERREQVRGTALAKILSKPTIVAISQVLIGGAAQQREDYAAIACAIQNIQLAAWNDGIGMQWSSGRIIFIPETYETLGLSQAQETLVGLLFFGYPAAIPAAHSRRPLGEVLRKLL